MLLLRRPLGPHGVWGPELLRLRVLLQLLLVLQRKVGCLRRRERRSVAACRALATNHIVYLRQAVGCVQGCAARRLLWLHEDSRGLAGLRGHEGGPGGQMSGILKLRLHSSTKVDVAGPHHARLLLLKRLLLLLVHTRVHVILLCLVLLLLLLREGLRRLALHEELHIAGAALVESAVRRHHRKLGHHLAERRMKGAIATLMQGGSRLLLRNRHGHRSGSGRGTEGPPAAVKDELLGVGVQLGLERGRRS